MPGAPTNKPDSLCLESILRTLEVFRAAKKDTICEYAVFSERENVRGDDGVSNYRCESVVALSLPNRVIVYGNEKVNTQFVGIDGVMCCSANKSFTDALLYYALFVSLFIQCFFRAQSN